MSERVKLTQAERDGLEWLHVDGSGRVRYGERGSRDPAANTMHSLVRKGLAKKVVSRFPEREAFAFTDAGRAALQSDK